MQNLFMPILNGIADALHSINPDAEIYIDSPINTKPSAEGFFYINFPISVTQENYLQEFHRLRLSFDVAYYPPNPNGDNAFLLSLASYAMSEALRTIYPAEDKGGKYTVSEKGKKAFGLHTEIMDNAVHVLGAYDIFVDVETRKQLANKLEVSIKN